MNLLGYVLPLSWFVSCSIRDRTRNTPDTNLYSISYSNFFLTLKFVSWFAYEISIQRVPGFINIVATNIQWKQTH
jgi:hypothetical protein